MQQNDTTATSPVSDPTNYEGLYSSLSTVTITGAPGATPDKQEPDALCNPNPDLGQPAKASRSMVAGGPPVPPRRSNNPDQFSTYPSQPHLHNIPTSSSGQTSSTDGTSNKPLPLVAPKPKPRKWEVQNWVLCNCLMIGAVVHCIFVLLYHTQYLFPNFLSLICYKDHHLLTYIMFYFILCLCFAVTLCFDNKKQF